MNPVTQQRAASRQPFPAEPEAPGDDESPASTDGRAARWQHHRLQRRAELIRSARRAVHRLGPEASMEDIASSAGTSKSVFYRYFGDKSGLQQAVGEVVLDRMQARIREAVQEATSPAEGLFAMVNAYLQMAETSPNVYAFVTQRSSGESDGPGPAQDATFGHFLNAVTDMIAQPMEELLAEPGALLDYWPRAAIGLVRAAGEQWLLSPAGPQRPSQAEMATTLTSWLVDGVRPMVAAPGTTDQSLESRHAGSAPGPAPTTGKEEHHD
ncbi:TetR/AcrR family transcriptional regulator [Arthrobacter sp. Y-9]|uniref:TetR/AcrR family transcriptional regulator n=1 Tax=Arthrobacter sp. Y-9 TaxID=3039385 RepID=UPI00241D7FBE|nr:TetR/AcrR family transcriptional regulator [Arthrobacter sp. Y-9]WFR82649.1 TetR/AcrR family transcriptional regulator [Arthrobacter sp. Y-9]